MRNPLVQPWRAAESVSSKKSLSRLHNFRAMDQRHPRKQRQQDRCRGVRRSALERLQGRT